MKNKIIVSLFTLALVISCTTTKTVSNETLKPVAVVDDVKPHSEGKSLYEANCAKCHSLYNKSDFSAEQWKPIMLSMQKKAKVSDEQREIIYAYLTTP